MAHSVCKAEGAGEESQQRAATKGNFCHFEVSLTRSAALPTPRGTSWEV